MFFAHRYGDDYGELIILLQYSEPPRTMCVIVERIFYNTGFGRLFGRFSVVISPQGRRECLKSVFKTLYYLKHTTYVRWSKHAGFLKVARIFENP